MIVHRKKFWLILAGVLIAAIGIFNSIKASFSVSTVNADIGETAVLWHGYQMIGWAYLKHWTYNIDNWLLSLLPLHILLFQIFGDRPLVMLWFGYSMLIVNILMCSAIAYALGARITAIVVPLILLFTNYFTYAGLLTFAITHNSTNFYGLVCLFFVIKWIQKPQLVYLPIIFFLTVVAGFSDPWLWAAYILPMIIGQFVLLKQYWHSPDSKYPLWMLATLFFALFVISTKIFGIFAFASSVNVPINFHRDWIRSANIAIKDFAWMFNLTPGQFRFEHFNAAAPGWFSFIVVLLLVLTIGIKVGKKVAASPVLFNFFLTIVLSSVIVLLSFFALNEEKILIHVTGARYLINSLFFVILGIGVAVELYWRDLNNPLKFTIIGITLLYLIASLTSTLPTWKDPIKKNLTEYDSLINFLTENNLTYGYGDYWKTVASWLTNDRIRIRPLKFNSAGYVLNPHALILGNLQSSKLWYLPSELPKNQPNYFIILQKYEFGCQDVPVCVKSISQQFGEPEKTLHFQDYTILVWPHPLLDTILHAPIQ